MQLPVSERMPFMASAFLRLSKNNSSSELISASRSVVKVFFFLVGSLFSQQATAAYCAGWSKYGMTACAPTAIGACTNFYEKFLRGAGSNVGVTISILPNGGQGNMGDDLPVAGPACQVSWPYGGSYGNRDVYPLWGHADDQYTIKLVPLSGFPESSNVLTSVEPDKRTNLVAYVYDQNGQSVSGAKVQVEITEVVPNSGGHRHHEGRPKGTLSGGQPAGPNIITGSTGTSGLGFSFTAPAAAGDHKFKATCTNRTCTPQGPDMVWVGIKELIPLPATNGYVLLPNRDDKHLENHYMAYGAHIKLMQLADLYRRRFPGDPLLHINDASLVRGGLFDIDHNWSYMPRGHKSHRRGESVDIRANPAIYPSSAISEGNFNEFKRIAEDLGGYAKIHSPGESNQHFHVEF